MSKRLMISYEDCIGCRMCEAVCSLKNEGRIGPVMSRIKVVSNYRQGFDLPMLCKECENPPCVDSCPTKAIWRHPVIKCLIIEEYACTGCGLCISACPFGAIGLNDGIARKCDLCKGDPFCVKVCPTQAIKLTTIEDYIKEKTFKRVLKTIK